jgi:AraC family transcriptional regulator, transcriptional activator of pobA
MASKRIPVYDISDFQYIGTQTDFYANTFAEHMKQHATRILLPHRHVFYVSLLFTRGTGIHEIDFQTYDIHPGSVFMIFPGQVHWWESSVDADGYVIFHNKDFYNLYFSHERLNQFPFFGSTRSMPLIRLKPDELPKIEETYRVILNEYRQGGLMRFQKISSLLDVLYIDLSRCYLPADQMKPHNQTQLSHTRRLELLIEANFKEIKSPARYSEMMYMSERNLNRTTKLILNKTVSDLITEKVILEAKRMLIHTRDTVGQIALDLGYEDNSYFIRLFRKKTGQTPLEFQRNYLQHSMEVNKARGINTKRVSG